MLAIVGATGNVGIATARVLREAGMPVRAISRDAAKTGRLRDLGCEVAPADLQDAGALAHAIAGVDAVQIVLPLHPQSADPAADLHRSIQSIVEALSAVAPERLLLISDYGAHVAEDIGMPSVFHALEAEIRRLPGRKTILRSAEHMHNWMRVIPGAVASGRLPSLQDPVDMPQPTIAAPDVGRIAAALLLSPDRAQELEIVHAEGPRRYSAQDIAEAVGKLSARTIHAEAVPRGMWEQVFAQVPSSLADLLIKANDAKNQGGLVDVEPGVGAVRYGTTELIDALKPLVPSEAGGAG